MGTDSFTYDANGNQATRNVGGNSYALSYDAENRLVGVTGAAMASFVYDGDGTRVKGTIGGVTMTYVGNPSMLSGQVYFEWKTSTSDMIRYYYAGNTRVAMRTGSNTLNYLIGDHLGSTVITTDSSGNRTAEIRYYPWGTERYTFQTTPTTYHFTGQREESEIGLYFYGARWYDSYLGRWIQPDYIVPEKIQGVQAWDRFAYANNNPLKFTDPNGHTIYLPCTICGQTWGDYSSTTGLVNQAIDVVSGIGCFFLGCHVNTINDIISGPDESEIIESSVISIAPIPLTVLTPPGIAQALGKVGEAKAGIIRNITRIESMTGTAKYRIPDELNAGLKLISEVKNVAYQSFTNQLRDFSLYAQKAGYEFNLYVREGTILSQPLKEAIETGKIILKFFSK